MSGISTATALLVSAGVGLATTGATLGYEMSQGGPPTPTGQTTSQQQAEAANAASMAQAESLQKRRGMASTTLTSPLGAGNATTQKATLG